MLQMIIVECRHVLKPIPDLPGWPERSRCDTCQETLEKCQGCGTWVEMTVEQNSMFFGGRCCDRLKV